MTVLTIVAWVVGIGVWISVSWLVGLQDVKCATLIVVGSYFMAWGACSSLFGARHERVQGNFVLLSFTLMLLLAALELPSAVNLIDYQEIFPRPRGTWTIRDRELGEIGKPYYRVILSTHVGDLGAHLCFPPHQVTPYQVRADRNGFRNAVDYDRADIAVIGDSFIENGAVPDEALLTSPLAQLQKRTVVNLGHASYGPLEELIVLRRYALPLKPKTIIWAFFEGNDLDDIPRYYANQALLSQEGTVWQRSFTRNVVIAAVTRLSRCRPHEEVKIFPAVFKGSEGLPQQFLVGYPSDRLTKKDFKNLEQAVATIKQAFRLATENEARLIVIFIPTKFRVYHDLLTFLPEAEPLNWQLNALPALLKSSLAEISPDIGYLDLTQSLYRVAYRGHTVFFPDDTHLNEEGNRVAARAVHEMLVESSAVKRHDVY